jgi:hypothetical protein
VGERMIVTCCICGWDGHIFDYEVWNKGKNSYPALWICDVCAAEIR